MTEAERIAVDRLIELPLIPLIFATYGRRWWCKPFYCIFLRILFPYHVDMIINEKEKRYVEIHEWIYCHSNIDTSWNNIWARWLVEEIFMTDGITGKPVLVGRKIENFRFYFRRHQDAVFFKMVWGGTVGP